MELMKLRYVPDPRDRIWFNFTPRSLDECCEQIKELCETYRDELYLTEFFVETEEDGELVFKLSGILREYIIKDKYKDLEPKISELFHQCFPPMSEE